MIFRVLIFIAVLAVGYLLFLNYGYRYVLDDVRAAASAEMVMGDLHAPVNIVAYMDYESDASRQLHATFLNLIAQNQNASILIRPVEGASIESQLAARLALAAEHQGRFMDLHNILMNANGNLTEGYLQSAAQSLQMDYNALKSEALTPEIEAKVTGINSELLLLNISTLPQYYVEHVKMEGAQQSIIELNDTIKLILQGRL